MISAPEGSSPSRTRSWATRASESRQASGSDTARPRWRSCSLTRSPEALLRRFVRASWDRSQRQPPQTSRQPLGSAADATGVPGGQPAARSGRTRPSTGPWTEDVPGRVERRPSGQRRLVQLVQLAPAGRHATARAVEIGRRRPGSRWRHADAAGGGRCARPTGRGRPRSRVPAVDGLGRLGCRAERSASQRL